jgi:hypothetical protein
MGGVAQRLIVKYFEGRSSKHFEVLKGGITEVMNLRGEYEPLVLHLNIVHFDKCRKCRMFLSTVVSVACSSQLLQVSHVIHKCCKHQTKHTAMMMTPRRHLEYLRHLIWRREND